MMRPRAVACAAAAMFVLVTTLTFSTSVSASALDSTFGSANLAASSDPASELVPSGRLIVSADSDGAWNIFTADSSGSAWQRISTNATPARDPAISPDGKTIAFRSKRDGTWDIYTTLAPSPLGTSAGVPTDGSAPTRLTRGMIYSGAPVWSPDGKQIAFESYARGDLDVWTMNADGTQAVDLTDDSKQQDYGPAWSPDGKWIAFTSWRTGTQQIFIVPPDCATRCPAINISQNKFDDQEPAWSPDGKKIAFVSDRDGQRAIYIADFSVLGLKNIRRLTFSGWDDQPAWSPDDKWIAFVSARPTRQPVYIIPADGGIPHIVSNSPAYAGSVEWVPDAAISIDRASSDSFDPLYVEHPDLAAAGSGHPYELRRITSARLEGGYSKLSSLVANSFGAMQARVKQEVGYDFLAILSDMSRPVDMRCDITCDTLSWHKAGRAFDTRLDSNYGLELVREDQQGETFWRVFLRATAQDGTMGEPMKEAPWDMSYNARWIVAPGAGGTKKPVPYGFYVDFTELAQQYGWTRISSQDSADFDWKTNSIGAEYWHFQKLDGLNWYQAMRQVYSANDLKDVSDWNSLAGQAGYDQDILYLKGIPEPPSAARWNLLGP